MDPLSMLFSGGMTAASIWANQNGQQQTNQMQQQMMQQQQSFQERMSSTAYQRASADMQAAGLNPMMMFSTGSAASSPSGASPSPMVKSGLDADSIQKGVNTGMQMRVQDKMIDNLVEQNAKIKAETATEAIRPGLVRAQEVATDTHGLLDKQRTKAVTEGLPIIVNEALTARHQAGMNSTARKALDVGSFGGKAIQHLISPVTDVISSARGVRSLFSDRWHY